MEHKEMMSPAFTYYILILVEVQNEGIVTPKFIISSLVRC